MDGMGRAYEKEERRLKMDVYIIMHLGRSDL